MAGEDLRETTDLERVDAKVDERVQFRLIPLASLGVRDVDDAQAWLPQVPPFPQG